MIISTASRLSGVQEYYFAAKLREIAQMRADGIPVINLGIGSPDLPPAATVTQQLSGAAAAAQKHGYQSYTGIPALRKAWASWYEKHYQTRLNENQVLPLMGSKEGIMHLAMTFLEPGDIALAPNPGYPTYTAATRLAGAEVQYYELSESNGWMPDLEALSKTDLSRVKLMWVNYPHMPTGAPANRPLFEQLVQFARRHKLLLVNDNPYSFILNDEPQSLLAIPGALDVALELNSLSKSHNMAGWRVGALLGREDYLQAVLRFKSNMDSGQFLPIQEAVVEALQLPDDWYQTLNETYRIRRACAFQLLDELECTFDPAQQGLFVWARVNDRWPDGYALSDHLLYHAGVFLTPGGVFGSAGHSYIRISLCQDTGCMEQAIQQITQLQEAA